MGLGFLRPRSHLLFQLANPRAVIFHKADEGVGGFHTPAPASPQSPVTGNCSPGHCPEHKAGTRADDLGGRGMQRGQGRVEMGVCQYVRTKLTALCASENWPQYLKLPLLFLYWVPRSLTALVLDAEKICLVPALSSPPLPHLPTVSGDF